MEKQEAEAGLQVDSSQPNNSVRLQCSKSQYCIQYQQFFEAENYPPCKEHLIAQLHRLNAIDSTSNHQQAYAKIKLINFTSSFEVIRLEVQLASFLIEIVALNVQGKSEAHNFENISDTGSPVFINEKKIKNTAIKCTPINNSSFIDIFFRVIKQYVIYKICSILHIGPALSNIFGFDIIVYDDCIQFCMEKCLKVPPQIEMHRLQLKKKLHMMHQLQIVHLDIKPANICWSPSINQSVFIDFGCSEILRQQIGENTSTRYVGSFKYCSPELLKCYNNPKALFMVDLYYNDVHALNKTFLDLFDQPEQTKINFEQQPQIKPKHSSITFQQKTTWMQIKYKVFQNVLDIDTDSEVETFILNHLQQFLLFCRTIIYSEYIQHIYSTLKQKSKECSKVLDQSYEKLHYQFNFNGENISHIRSNRNNRYFIPMIDGFSFQRNTGRNQEGLLVNPNNIRELLLNKAMIERVNREIYYKNLIYFINMQHFASKFSEKIQVCKIFCQISGLDDKDTGDGCLLLSNCFIYLMSYYLKSERQGCIDIIPMLLGSIIILEAVSQQQLLQYYLMISNLNLRDSKEKAFLIYRCELCLQWIALIIDPKYEACQAGEIVRKMNSKLLLQLSENIKDKNHKNLKLVYDIYNYGCNKFSLGILKQLQIGREDTFSGSVMKRELGLYYYLHVFQYQTYNNNYKEAGRHVKIILNLLQHLNNVKHFLHFMIRINFIMFYCQTKNYKKVNELFFSFQKCLDNPNMIQKFRLTSYNAFLDFMFQRRRISSNYFTNILNIIKSQYVQTDLQILQYVSFIYTNDTENLNLTNNDCKKAIQEIFAFLRQKFPITLLENFKAFSEKYQTNPSAFFRTSHNLLSVLNQIYKNHPDVYSLIMRYKDSLEQLRATIACSECKYIALRHLISLQANSLHKKGNIQGIIELYIYYLDTGNCRQNDRLFYYLEIIRYSLKKPAYFHIIEPQITKFYETVHKNDLWGTIFTLPRPQMALEILHKYLLLNQRLCDFFEVHIKLAQNIKYNPSKEYVFCYSKYLIEFFASLKLEENLVLNNIFLEHFKNYPLKNYQADFHTTIFCSLLLPCLPYEESYRQFRTKITLFICKHIHKLLPFFKAMVLAHLHFPLIVMEIIKINEAEDMFFTASPRLMKYYYKSYLKYSISQETFPGFVNAVSDLSILRKQLHISPPIESIVNHLRSYFRSLQTISLGLESIVRYYNSPVKDYKLRVDY